MNENKNNTFEYSYSAPTEEEKREIASIRRQYETVLDSPQSKFARLKALDAKVKCTATVVALILGVVGILVFGLGLTLVLEWEQLVWGIVVMLVGSVPTSLAYPAHGFFIKRGKKKYGEEILRLSKELLNRE